jgi:XTP/dITP diphosphohydrolase
MEKTLIIATRNVGKTKEFQALFADFGYTIKDLTDYPELPEIEETGMTFEENARLKAEKIAEIIGEVVVGDDSGLCVDVLGGLPGIWSHRFSEPNPTDEKNIAKLLHELAPTAIAPERRSAHFHTTLVAAQPGRESLVVEADWNGYIGLTPKGENGFGYDPIFLVDAFRTAAELSAEEKNRLSHRGQALQKLMKELPIWLEK